MPLTLPDSRVLIAQAPLGHGRSGGALVLDPKARIPIGIEVWPGQLAVIAKITFSFDPALTDQVATIAPRQLPLTVADPHSSEAASPLELAAPHDFAHFKPQTDLLLQGSAFAPKALPTIHASLVVTSASCHVERHFTTVGPSPIERMPLLGGFLRDKDGETHTAPVGPAGPWSISAEEIAAHRIPSTPLDEDIPPVSARIQSDPGHAYVEEIMGDRLMHSWMMLTEPRWLDESSPTSYAAPLQRTRYGQYLESDAVIDITGLSQGGERRIVRLPGLSPWLVCETRLDDYFLDPKLDTVTLHTDLDLITVVWRGQVPIIGEQPQWEVHRVIVTVESDRDERPLGAVYRDLQRGQFFRASEEKDIRGTADDWEEADDDLELELEAYDAFDLPSEPTITLEQYATITAALASGNDTRANVLAGYGLDEDLWLLEDQGWIEKISEAVTTGNFALSDGYGEMYKKSLKAFTEQPEGES